jgi:hypothetical protein
MGAPHGPARPPAGCARGYVKPPQPCFAVPDQGGLG